MKPEDGPLRESAGHERTHAVGLHLHAGPRAGSSVEGTSAGARGWGSHAGVGV